MALFKFLTLLPLFLSAVTVLADTGEVLTSRVKVEKGVSATGWEKEMFSEVVEKEEKKRLKEKEKDAGSEEKREQQPKKTVNKTKKKEQTPQPVILPEKKEPEKPEISEKTAEPAKEEVMPDDDISIVAEETPDEDNLQEPAEQEASEKEDSDTAPEADVPDADIDTQEKKKEDKEKVSDPAPEKMPPEQNTGTSYPVNFSLFPPFSLAGPDDTANVEFSLAASYTGSVKGLSLGFGVSIVKNDFAGMQLTFVYNHVSGNAYGIHLSAGANWAGTGMHGLQLSNVFNYAGGESKGFQISSGLNISGGAFMGVQASSGLNIALGHFSGQQLSSGVNYADSMTGFQMGLLNISGNTVGVQAGLLNIAGNTGGLQFSLINIAKKIIGVQFGLINIADEITGVPIGLFNFSRNMDFSMVLWGGYPYGANLGFKFLFKYVYYMYSISAVDLFRSDNETLAFGFRYGGHIPIKKFYIDFDLGFVYTDHSPLFSQSGTSDRNTIESRLIFGYTFNRWISVIAGGGFSYQTDITADGRKREFVPIGFAGIELF